MTGNHNRNPGVPLDLDWVMGAHINKSAVERRTATLTGRRTVKKDGQAAWLVRAITNIDLTTLAGDDTPGRIHRLCAKAKQPLRPDMLEKLGLNGERITVGAVCVYPNRVADAVHALQGSNIQLPLLRRVFLRDRLLCHSAFKKLSKLWKQAPKKLTWSSPAIMC